MKIINKILKDAHECTPIEMQYIEVFTTGARYVATPYTSSKVPLEDIQKIRGSKVLVHHLKNAPGYTMSGKNLRDSTERVALIEINLLANDVNRVPTKVRLCWE